MHIYRLTSCSACTNRIYSYTADNSLLATYQVCKYLKTAEHNVYLARKECQHCMTNYHVKFGKAQKEASLSRYITMCVS